MSYKAWYKRLQIPWLVGRENGIAEASAIGDLLDEKVDQLIQARQACFPDKGPADALPHIGADRGLIQGYWESDADFRIRLKDAWAQWALAGTPVELLYQLYFTCGLSNAAIVTQNGLAFTLDGPPSPGVSPVDSLVIRLLGPNPNVVPGEIHPWWTFDDRDDLCNRFAIILGPDSLPPSFLVKARVEFDGTSATATGDWSWAWDGVDYLTACGPAVTIDESIPAVAVDSSSNTTTTVTVNASAPFEGYVDVIGYLSGSNPFASPSLSTQALIKRVVSTWRPAKARYMGLTALVDGNIWGWPVGLKWGQTGLKWGGVSSVFLEP